jgi:hypothetical protein
LLTREEAERRIESYKNPQAVEELDRRLRQLPSGLADLGCAWRDVTIARWRPQAAKAGLRQQAVIAFERLSSEHRQRLFAAFFPEFAEHAESAWQLQKRLPFQTGWMRKAFRAPSDAEYTSEARARWLESLLNVTLRYRCDLEFLTIWAPHLGWGQDDQAIGILLAAALDSRQMAATFHLLSAIVNGEHSTASIGRYVIIALLTCDLPRAWELVERLLLAAQRQEGLRQVVLESVDFAHPEAFERILRLILSEKLSRFAAVARAVCVWLGLEIDSSETKLIDGLITELLENLADRRIRRDRIATATGQSLYVALWTAAYHDAPSATEDCTRICPDRNFERRYPAVRVLSQIGTLPASRALVACVDDPDLRIALVASACLPAGPASFAALQRLIPRVAEDRLLEPAIWHWNRIRARQSAVVRLLIDRRGSQPFRELAPFIPQMDAYTRRSLLLDLNRDVEKRGAMEPDQRAIVLSLLPDASSSVREEAFKALEKARITAAEAEAMEPLLARKASDLRRGVMSLLLKQDAAGCRASIDRLSRSGDVLMQQAAEELRSEVEPKSVPAASLADGFGLYDPATRTQPIPPNELNRSIGTKATVHILASLEAEIDKHRETPVTVRVSETHSYNDLFGNLQWLDAHRLPLREVWAAWWSDQAASLDSEGDLELVRARCAIIFLSEVYQAAWFGRVWAGLGGGGELRFPKHSQWVLDQVLLRELTPRVIELLLDALETYLHRIHAGYTQQSSGGASASWRTREIENLIRTIDNCRQSKPEIWSDQQWGRYWNLRRWIDEHVPVTYRIRPDIETVLEARRRGVATEADLIEHILAESLRLLTARKPHRVFSQYPDLAGIVARCRNRVLEVEITRGDLPTDASKPALCLRSVYGAPLAIELLQRLVKEPLARGSLYHDQSKAGVLSHLLRVSLPETQDTPERFAVLAKAARLSKKQLFNLGIYALQWARHVEQASGVIGFADAAFWLHAHTKDAQWSVDVEIRELWFAETSERTPLGREELLDGAVDVDWFRHFRAGLSEADWALMLASAKYASGGAGHKRAELFACAMDAGIAAEELTRRIVEKRSQDSVRTLGLLPLPFGADERRRELLARYQMLQKFLRESRSFGALRQASEKLAYSIGLANLARTAGYPDPQRLSWAMESEAVADLRNGPVEAVDSEVRGVLSVNPLGEPEIRFEKNSKVLKDLPAALRKSPALAALRARKSELSKQSSRMRRSLEEAMIRGDRFEMAELRELEAHPLLRPMIGSLLFVGEGGDVRWYSALDEASGHQRIAHAADLLRSGQWSEFQRTCVDRTHIQPFKQAFRELYLLTDAERANQTYSARYEGQQVNPQQALAIVGKRGWVNVPDEGIRKTFHGDNISVWITFLGGWLTPVEVDGLTVEHIAFANRSTGAPIALDQIDERIFSETMRDVDLMVSVAHRGGVDPEAAASTVEMRASLLREVIRLMKIGNVRIAGSHAFVDGKTGAYNIHLGSGVVHRQPGGSICIVPVHSQHRGRLFLPFADDDPKTAEVISKVLLLAQDDKIKDPTVLEQLRR